MMSRAQDVVDVIVEAADVVSAAEQPVTIGQP